MDVPKKFVIKIIIKKWYQKQWQRPKKGQIMVYQIYQSSWLIDGITILYYYIWDS